MQKLFPGYQPRSARDLAKLWDSCTFAFDASALLDLYGMTHKSRDEFLSILDRLKERVWLPHQAGLEYYDNRMVVITAGLRFHKQIGEWARDAADRFKKDLDGCHRYQWIEAGHWVQIFTRACEQVDQLLSKKECALQGYETSDPIENRLSQLFGERVGAPYKNMHEIYEQAERRIQLSIPPGFRDAAQKKDYRRYGDVILWLQLLDHAKSSQKAMVFVTSDSKEDWWQRQSGKTLGPRPELVQEMHVIAGVTFHLYSPATFIEHAQRNLKLQAETAKIRAAATELRNIDMGRAITNILALDSLGRSAQDRLPAHLLQASFGPLSNLRGDEFIRLLESTRSPLEKILGNPLLSTSILFTDPIKKAFEETVIGPVAQFRETAAQLAEALRIASNPLGIAIAMANAGQSQPKPGLKEPPGTNRTESTLPKNEGQSDAPEPAEIANTHEDQSGSDHGVQRNDNEPGREKKK